MHARSDIRTRDTTGCAAAVPRWRSPRGVATEAARGACRARVRSPRQRRRPSSALPWPPARRAIAGERRRLRTETATETICGWVPTESRRSANTGPTTPSPPDSARSARPRGVAGDRAARTRSTARRGNRRTVLVSVRRGNPAIRRASRGLRVKARRRRPDTPRPTRQGR